MLKQFRDNNFNISCHSYKHLSEDWQMFSMYKRQVSFLFALFHILNSNKNENIELVKKSSEIKL